MGQSYCIVNPAKKQFIYPHNFGEGYKEWEVVANGRMAKGLLFLIAVSNEGGGGDLAGHNYGGKYVDPENPQSKIYGSWAGDPLYFVGDYDTSAPHSEGFSGLYEEALHSFEDVSFDVLGDLMKEEVYDDGELLAIHSWVVGIIGVRKGEKKPADFKTWSKGEQHSWETDRKNAKKLKVVVPLMENHMSPETLAKAKAGKYYD